ncbi:MAG: aminoacyl-tRNA hydrolase [Candidatus Paceibacteria bacterium]
MKIVFGLGNPKEQYFLTRHNIGRRIIEELLNSNGWQERSGLCLVQEKGERQNKIIFVKSLLYMNESGKVASWVLRHYKVAPEKLLVIHDDADILFGKLKLSFGSRSAGHKGVESIIQALGTLNFWRLRIGIQPELGAGRIRAEALILKRFSRKEEEYLPEIIKKAHSTIAAWLEQS